MMRGRSRRLATAALGRPAFHFQWLKPQRLLDPSSLFHPDASFRRDQEHVYQIDAAMHVVPAVVAPWL